MEIDVSGGFDLGCFHYKVKLDEETGKILRSNNLYGSCSSQMEVIELCSKESPDRLHEVFIHEVVEAVVEHSCYKKVKHEEITNLANGLAQALKSMGVMFVVKSPQPKYADLELQRNLVYDHMEAFPNKKEEKG